MKRNVFDIARARADCAGRNADYNRILADIRPFIDEIDTWCQMSALDLALAGVWREWSREQPEDFQLGFDPVELGDCGDPLIVMLVRLYEQLLALRLAIDERK